MQIKRMLRGTLTLSGHFRWWCYLFFQPLDVKKLQAELPKYPWKFFYPSEGVGGKFPATATDFEDKKWIYDCRRGCPGPPATRGSGKREFIREEEHPYELEDIKDATKKGKRKPRAEYDLFEDGTRIFGAPDGFENRTPRIQIWKIS